MSDISRDEFDRLRERVERIERTLDATVRLVAAEVVGMRTAIDEQFATVITMIGAEAAHLDRVEAGIAARFDSTDAKLDRILDRLGGDQ